MKDIIKIVCLIIATIIGAGFSSGREIYTFFNMNEKHILFILVTTFITMYITIKLTLNIGYNKKIYNYNTLIEKIYNKRLKKYIEIIFNLFLLIIYSIMLSGFGELLNMVLDVNKIYGTIILIVICYITLLSNIQGIIRVGVFIVPIIIMSILYLFITAKSNTLIGINYEIQKTNYFAGIIYVGYNLIIAIPVIIESSKLVKNKKQIEYVALISSTVITGLICIIYLVIQDYMFYVQKEAMPMIYISSQKNIYLKYIYSIVIAMSIYTTAISTEYSLVQKYTKSKYIIYLLLVSFIAFMISLVSFNKLIDICFPIIGIVGICQTVKIFIYKIKNNN